MYVYEYLIENLLVKNKDEAVKAVLSGKVFSENSRISSVNEKVSFKDKIIYKKSSKQYVSRGGSKIASIFSEFNISVFDKTGIDLGASTGGFTDFLLQQQAKVIVTIDVNYGELDYRLRRDSRVIEIERTNIRTLTNNKLNYILKNHPKNKMIQITSPFDFIVGDLSFISLKLILPKLKNFLREKGDLLLLFKPQFEAPKEQVPEGGIITDKKLIAALISDFIGFVEMNNYSYIQHLPSEITGTKGNQEYFIHLKSI